jgi:diguanylate cyclase (GGDEF)-like protein
MAEAKTLFREATALAVACDDRISAARGYENIASVAIEAGRFEDALTEVERGFAIAQPISNPEVHANLHATRGKALRVGQRTAEALQAFAHAGELVGAEQNKRFAIELNDEISLAREALGDTAGALQALRRARSLEREVNTDDARRRLEAIAFRHEVERAHSRAARFERLAHEDPLTGLSNRRWLELRLDEARQPDAFDLRPLSAVMLDVDHFKQINDRLSHATGDQALRAVARILREHCRERDLAARYGGEEFALLLPATPLAAATAIAERIRAAVACFDWPGVQPGLQVTLSAGVACAIDFRDVGQLLARADAALYRAKAAGRNRISD